MKTKFSVIFLIILTSIVAGQDIHVLKSTQSEFVFDYVPNIKDTNFFVYNGRNYVSLEIEGTYIENENFPDSVQLPVREFKLGVASETGNTIQILFVEESQIDGIYSFDRTPNTLTQQRKRDFITFGEYGLIRNLPFQSFLIYPVRIDAETGETHVIKRLRVRINLSSSNREKIPVEEDFLQYSVLNWNVARNWGVNQSRLSKVNVPIFSSGKWFRFEADEEGIYKIDKSFLESMGINIAEVDPKTIKIYSVNGYALPENIEDESIGFNENAIYIKGEEDGVFNDGDYILFYSRGIQSWEYNKSRYAIQRVKNPFTRKNYFWLTFGGNEGKRMPEKPSLNSSDAYKQNTTLSYVFSDKDSVKIAASGRDYFGDVFSGSRRERIYLNTLYSLVPGTKINYKFRLINTSSDFINYSVRESNQLIYSGSISLNARYSYTYGMQSVGTASYSNQLTDNRSNLKFTVNTNISSASVYLDYFEIEYQRYLQSTMDFLIFFSKDTNATIEYRITDFSNSDIFAFDLTNPYNVNIVTGAYISGGEIRFQSQENKHNVSKYIALNSSAFKTPANGTQITPTDILSNVSGSRMIVITNKYFKEQAERYAAYRNSESSDPLSTSIYYVDDIMNQFSGGMLEPTSIRNFLKYAYDNWQTKPQYVLFFGDGDYDYLNVVPEDTDKNFVPTYQTEESLSEINSYSTDDYYARVSGIDKAVDLATGRLAVQTLSDAEAVVDKIKKYERESSTGPWRYRITLIADDGLTSEGDDTSLHTRQSEELILRRISSAYDLNKIYLVAYPTVITGLGRRKPEVNKAIVNAFNNGTLLANYIGHGNPNTWAHEYVFEKATTIPQLKNSEFFFLTAATCDFGKYDDMSEQSSTELMVNMPDGGAIGIFTAARVVYATSNAAINDTFYTYLFKRTTEGKPLRIGDVFMLTKQNRTAINDEKFHLFCDPSLRLKIPAENAKIDSVNGTPVNQTVQINALGSVNIKGSLEQNSAFNGEAIISVYDSERRVYYDEINYSVIMPGGLIYRGRSSVENSKYSTEFVVPKDISYENKNGKITAYVFNENNDAVGYTNNVIVGGTNPNAVNDGKGPEIEIYFDNEEFDNAYLVNPDFTLIVKLFDETGLNTTGTGIGHKLEGILDGDENNAIDFTNYFVGDLNSGGKSGAVKYKFTSLSEGEHNIKIKAWDVFNNFSETEVYFTVVSKNDELYLRNVYNYPNPFSSSTTFTFQHNVNSALDVKIKIYTVAGRLIKEIEEYSVMDRFVRIDWDGRDEDGNSLANGTYLYKIVAQTTDGSFKKSALGKLSIIR